MCFGIGEFTSVASSSFRNSCISSFDGLLNVPWCSWSMDSMRSASPVKFEYSVGSFFCSCSSQSRESARNGMISLEKVSHTSVPFKYPRFTNSPIVSKKSSRFSCSGGSLLRPIFSWHSVSGTTPLALADTVGRTPRGAALGPPRALPVAANARK